MACNGYGVSSQVAQGLWHSTISIRTFMTHFNGKHIYICIMLLFTQIVQNRNETSPKLN